MLRPEAQSRPRSISLRAKLTLWMVVIFLVVQLSLGFVFELYQRRSINEFFDARLKARLDQVAEAVVPLLPAVQNVDLYSQADRNRELLFQKFFLIQVFDESGVPVASSEAPAAPLPPAVLSSLLGSSGPISVPLPLSIPKDSGAARAAAKWVPGPDGRRFVVLIAWSDMYAQEMLRLLSGVLFFSIPIGVAAVAISAYAISGIAVRPIRAMGHMARGLEPEFLGERVKLTGSGTELAELQQSLEGTRLKLEAAFGAQERFMSNVSHELKTPIAVLMTEAQTLKLDQSPKEVRAFVESTLDELYKLGRMVDSFLLLTRVRHGKATVPNQESCLVRDIMVYSYEGCAPMAAQHGCRIAIRLPEEPHMDVAVRGNCDLLRSVLDNLIRNAIRFNPKDHVVHVRGEVVDDRLLIRVRDQGPGIPTALLPRIFDRFAQSTDEQRRGRGHGLGLEIALGITELHGGTISAANCEDGGCEFTISLPIDPATDCTPPLQHAN